jgi:WS/DGAT/MGAT family acyltransferase
VPEGFDDFMSDADALMWAIESDPLLRSTIVTALVLDRAPSWESVVEKLERGVRLIPRMRQRVVEPAFGFGTPAWSDDPFFDLSYHARRVRNPDPTNDRIVYELASTAATEAFDRDRPLWEYTLVEDLPDGKAAFVMKVHHSMTDGVGGIKLLLMLLDLERYPPPPGPEPDPLPLAMFSPWSVAMHRLAVQRATVRNAAARAVPVAFHAANEVRRNAVGLVGTGAKMATSAARFLAPAPTPASPLLRPRSLGRQVDAFDVPLDDLKRAAKALGVSLNDVFVGSVLGGMHRYHEEHDTDAPELRMIMPISVRGDGGGLGGNHFTPARVMVPTRAQNAVRRIEEISERCRRLRAEPAVAMTEQLAGVLNLLPRRAATALMGSMFKGADLVTSNVPGAPFPLYLGGAEIERIYAFGPLSGTSTNVTLLSHSGTCCIGINVDSAAVPDHDVLVGHLRGAFAEALTLG